MSLRFGILGTAKVARRAVIPAIAAAGCEVTAVASRTPAAAAAVADPLGAVPVHGYAPLLARDDVDAVYIPLPNHLHAEWAIAAAEAGKHVLCEKPLAMTAADAAAMVEAARAAGVVLAEAYMYRHHPAWVEARRLVANGAIGEPLAVDTWFTYFNDNPTDIRNVAEWGGGGLLDIGCYAVDASRLLLGADAVPTGVTMVRDPASGVDILTAGTLGFPAGRSATFTCSTRAARSQGLQVFGSAGRLIFETPFNPPDGISRVLVEARGEHRWQDHGPTDHFARMIEAFVATVAGAEPEIPPEWGVDNLRVIEALFAMAAHP